MKNNKGRGGGGGALLETRELNNFLPLKRGAYLRGGGGVLNRGYPVRGQ